MQKNTVQPQGFTVFLVEATGIEPTTSASRTLRATSCATPRFFQFLSIFVSGQTCGQATYFERFVKKFTARIVSVVKGFRGSKKTTKKSPCGCPEYYGLPTMLHHILDRSVYIISNAYAKVKSFSPFYELFL